MAKHPPAAEAGFPALYHAHHLAYDEDIPFWVDLSQQYAGPVLELGCGTGRVLLPLLQAGVKAVGLDVDWHMLAYLHRSKPDNLPLPAVFQADMTAFRLGANFPLILLPCNTLSSLDTADRLLVYQQVKAHLEPGGRFVASLPNPRSLVEVDQEGEEEVETEFEHPLSGSPVVVSSAWQRTRTDFLLTWHYDHLMQDGQVERLSVRTRHSLQDRRSYQRELAAAGLKVVTSWGDFDKSAYGSGSPYWIFSAEVD